MPPPERQNQGACRTDTAPGRYDHRGETTSAAAPAATNAAPRPTITPMLATPKARARAVYEGHQAPAKDQAPLRLGLIFLLGEPQHQ